MKSAEVSVLVGSCDKYADLLPPFLTLFRKFWPDCPYEIVLVTESDPHLPFDRTIACGSGKNWASRLVEALDAVDTPYVLMLCDDYYLEAPVDTALIESRLEEMKRARAVNLRMIPNPRPTENNSVEFSSDLRSYRIGAAYSVATQAGLWDRGFLKHLATGKTSIWDFERLGSFEKRDERFPLLVTKKKEFPFIDAVHKGYWEKAGVRVLRENAIEYDFRSRSTPPAAIWMKEALKVAVFAVVPTNWIVRVQNRFGLGAQERKNMV